MSPTGWYRRTGRPLGIVLTLALLAATVPAAVTLALECEGQCEDQAGAIMLVNAGECDSATEYCRAGCDLSKPGRPRPYAECVSRVSGAVAPRREVIVPTDDRRE